jgi:hypothetical protein
MPTRRTVLKHGLAAGGATLLAGCGGQSGDGPVPGFDPEGRTVTVFAPRGGGPQQLNPYSLNQRGGALLEPFQQLVLPTVTPTGEVRTSGHTVTVDGRDVSVPCAVADYSVDVDGVTTTFEPGLTYWSGAALDAEAYFLADRVSWLAFEEFGAEFPHELVSDTEYRRAVDTDSRAGLRGATHPGPPPLPQGFTEPWVDRLEAASSQDARDEEYAELNAESVTVERVVEEGWGSGTYRVESTDDVAEGGIGARRREDHPADVAVPNLVVRTPRPPAVTSLVRSGDVDLGSGHIADQGGDFQRDAVPESIQHLSRYPSPVAPGFQLVFNWANSHLRRLWVRRALAAALPTGQVLSNALGERGRPVEQDSGILPGVATARLGADAVDALYDYPAEADTGTASEWLELAGYTREGEQWHGPGGDPLALRLAAASPPGSVVTSVATGLREFGVGVEVTEASPRPTNEFAIAVEEGQYDLVVARTGTGFTAADYYAAPPNVRGGTVVGSSLAVGGATLGTCDVGTGWLSPPETVTVPADPGLRIEGGDYPDGGTTYQHEDGTDIDVCAAIETVRAPDSSVADRREAAVRCARWYNYALPTFVFGVSRRAVFGNTEAFAFPDSEAGRHTARVPAWSPVQYHVQAGTVR